MSRQNVLMCGSRLDVKGGMVSVIKNYLSSDGWDNMNIVYVPTHIEKGKLAVAIFFAFSYFKIICLHIKYRFKIAHLHTAERGSFFRKAILLHTLKGLGVKVILHHHGAEFEDFYNSLSDKRKQFVVKTLEKADVNIVLSKQHVKTITGKTEKANVFVLYNSVKTNDTNPFDNSATNVLFLGRLGKRKGTYDLLNAISRIDEELSPEIRFLLCGDGEVEEVEKEIDRLGIRHRIAHVGWVDGERKRVFISKTRLNVLPSYHEGLPMTILETMANGIPSISTKVASIPEVVVDGVTGCLIEPGDVDGLSRSLLRIANDAELCAQYGKESYNLILKNFRLEENVKHLCNLYRQLLASYKG